MKNKKVFWLLCALLVALLLGAGLLYNNLKDSVERDTLATTPPAQTETEEDATVENTENSDAAAEQELTMAPDFTVIDNDGNAVKLSDMIGRPVVLNFWASWCEPCKSEMADFNEAWAEYGDRVHFMMVNSTDGSRETVDTAKAYVTEQGFSFPVYYDTTYEAAIAFGASALPTTFFIDAEGHAIAYGQGAMDRATLQIGLDMILPKE